MRTLAARFISSETTGRIVKAAAIAVPMVLVECGGAPKNEVRPAPVVVIEAPKTAKAQSNETPGLEEEEGQGRRLKPPGQKQTQLNLHLYPGCILEAHLSVVNPDNSLDRVILDPKVDFSYAPSEGRFVGISCNDVPECDVSDLIRKNGSVLKHPLIMAKFKPAPHSDLAPAMATYVLMPPEVVDYCH